MITRGLSITTKAIEDAETELKILVKEAYFNNWNPEQINKEATKVIDRCLSITEIEIIKPEIAKALQRFVNSELKFIRLNLGLDGKLAKMMISESNKAFLQGDMTVLRTNAPGVANMEYHANYMKKVRKTMRQLADSYSVDPNDDSGNNSLRNLSEMAERQKFHDDQLAEFNSSGVKLVVCSVHADCSDRCYRWQGRVYSLDHTYGKTEDGREYVPLEVATDIWYTTRKGKRYKNGLLGFNCRHKLYEFNPGMRIPVVTKEQQKREDKLNQKQRELERQVRMWRDRALIQEDPEIRRICKNKAVSANQKYIAWCRKNERAYYPDRVRVSF